MTDELIELDAVAWDQIEQDELRAAEVRDRGQMSLKGQIVGSRKWLSHCVGSVEFSTNGPQGGAAGHGGFLRVTFQNNASTCIDVAVDHAVLKLVNTVALTFRGDAEINAVIDSLEFLARKLRATRRLWSRGQTRIKGQIEGSREYEHFCVGSVEFPPTGRKGALPGTVGFSDSRSRIGHPPAWRWQSMALNRG
jgi:hypothetical protein